MFFRTDVLAFYRPIQSYAFALLFHLFDANPLPFSLVLVLVHVLNLVLFGRLVQRLFEQRLLTLLSVAFYAANWEYCDVVFCKANYGTALSWLFSLAAANTFVDFVRRPRRWLLLVSVAFTLAALLSKETAINMPLLLGLIYGFAPVRSVRRTSSTDGAGATAETDAVAKSQWKVRAAEFAYRLLPFCVLVVVFAVFHRLMVHDVYDWPDKGYQFATPRGAVDSVARAVAFWLTPFLDAGAAVLRSAGGRSAIAAWLERHRYVLPLLALAVALVLRNRPMLFGLLWAVFAFFPANLLEAPHTARYYYTGVSGIAIVSAEIFLAAERAIASRWRKPVVSAARILGGLVILAIFYVNLAHTTKIVIQDARVCRPIREAYEFLTTLRGKVPHRTLFRVHCLSTVAHFHEGLGLREMFKLALDDDSIEAILPKQRLTDARKAMLENEYPPPIEFVQAKSGQYTLLMPKTSPAPEKSSPPE